MQRRRFLEATIGGVALGALATSWRSLAAENLANTAATAAQGTTMDAAAFHAARRFVPTASGQIACIDRGTGAAALFLHGFPLNSFQWRDAIARLSPWRRCIAPDFLGLGYTRVAEGQGVAPDDQVRMIVQLLDALGIADVDLIASDSGGAIAQLLLVRHPQRVRSLLLTNCDSEIDCPPPALLPVIELSKQGRYVDEWLVPWRKDPALARSAKGIGGMCYATAQHPSDEAIETYFAPLTGSAQGKRMTEVYAIALEPNALTGIETSLARSTVPVRILWGTADEIFSAASPDYLDRTLGNSQGLRRLAGSRLFWPEERPDVIVEEALRLWQAKA